MQREAVAQLSEKASTAFPMKGQARRAQSLCEPAKKGKADTKSSSKKPNKQKDNSESKMISSLRT